MSKVLDIFSKTINNSGANLNLYAPILKFAKYSNVDFTENSRFILRISIIGGTSISYGELYVATGKGSTLPFITSKYLIKPNFDCFISEESDCYILYVKANSVGTKVISQILYASNLGFLTPINYEDFTIDKTTKITIYEFTNYNSPKFPSESYFTTTTTTTSNMYAKIGKLTINTATQGATLGMQISERDNGNSTLIAGTVYFKARKQTSANPTLLIKTAGITTDFTFTNINVIGVIIDTTTIELYIQIKSTYIGYIFKPLIWDYTDNGTTVDLYGDQTLVSTLPTGTQVLLFTS